MVLTPRAEGLKPRVRDAVAVAKMVFDEPGQFDAGSVQRSFTLSVTDYVLLVFGALLDQRVTAGAPGLTLRCIPNALDDAARLRAGETDLAIGIYGDLPPELRTKPIITDRFVCVVRAGHPIVKRRLSLDQFVSLEHIQIAPRGTAGGYVDDQLAERGLSRDVVRAVPYFQVALEMTAASDRVLTVSERIARLLGPRLGLKSFDPPLPLEPFALSMVWHPRLHADAAHRWLRGALIEATSSLDGLSHVGARRRLSRSDPTNRGAR